MLYMQSPSALLVSKFCQFFYQIHSGREADASNKELECEPLEKNV